MMINTTAIFSPFQLVQGVVVLPIECEIHSLKLDVKILPKTSALEEHLVHLDHIDEQHQDISIMNEAHKKWVKNQYDKPVCPRVFLENILSFSMIRIRIH